MKTKIEKEAIERGIQEQDAYYRKKNYEEQRKRKKIEDPARPSLIKRTAGIGLDTLILIVSIFLIQVLIYFTLYGPLGYFKEEDAIKNLVDESHLFITNELGRSSDLIASYDDNKSPEENYDIAITYFYSHDLRAIRDDKLTAYEEIKISSSYFIHDGEGFIRTSSATDEKVKTLLENQYIDAVKYLKKDPIYINGSNKTLMISVGTILINSLIVTTLFFLVIPLTNKEKRTIGQMACGLALVNDKDKSTPRKDQIILRHLINYIFNFMLPASIYIAFPQYIGMPWFVSLGVLCFTKNFDSFHGLLSHTKVINVSRSNPMETLKQIKEMGESASLSQE